MGRERLLFSLMPVFSESNPPVLALCSGGDAPGMNAFLRACVRLGLNRHKVPVIGVRHGYKGLVVAAERLRKGETTLEELKAEVEQSPGLKGLIRKEQMLVAMDHASVSGIMRDGGTILGSARCREYEHDEVVRGAVVSMLRALGVRAVVVAGGDGSLRGAEALARESGLPVIGVPATIDNDMLFTEMALGVDTAVHTLVWAVDRFIDTARSHRRVMVLETMGRSSGDLARMAALASGAEMVITPDGGPLTRERMIGLATEIEEAMKRGREHAIVLVAEGVVPEPFIKRNIAYIITDAFQDHFRRAGAPFQDLEVRPSVLGHLQRGGDATPQDCLLAARFAERAWREIDSPEPRSGIAALRQNMVDLVPFGCADLPERIAGSAQMERLHRDLAHW
jgi:6-phosphofructokinase 1